MSQSKYLIGVGAVLASLVLAGCGQGAGQTAAAQPGEAGVNSGSGMVIPLRLSRAFFESNLTGSVKVTALDGSELHDSESTVAWKELPPTGPEPTGEYYADFRDRLGCANYQDSSDLELCFTVVPDVSSVDLTGEKIQLRGVEKVLRDAGQCGEESPQLTFVSAQKEQDAIRVQYQAQYSSCAPARIDLMLQRGA